MTLAYYFDSGMAVAADILIGIGVFCFLLAITAFVAGFFNPKWDGSDPQMHTIVSVIIIGAVAFVGLLIVWPIQHMADDGRRHQAIERWRVADAIRQVSHDYRTSIVKVRDVSLDQYNMKRAGYSAKDYKQADDTIRYRTVSGRECQAKLIDRGRVTGWVIDQRSVQCGVYEPGAYPGADPTTTTRAAP